MIKCVIDVNGKCRDNFLLPYPPEVGDEIGIMDGEEGYTVVVQKRRWMTGVGDTSEVHYLVLETKEVK